MAEIILSQAGAALGSHLLPSGIGLLGQTVSGAALGGFVGQVAGRAVDQALAGPVEGPRIKSLHIMESREGAGLPFVYGRMRVGGQVIWASRFKEYKSTQSSGKGGPSYTEYSYSVSFAVALCQGPITRVDRIWANGELMVLSEVNWRLYTGIEDQEPDPLIEAIEGTDQAPAYRGTAYVLFEDLPLDAYGYRLPQLSFEVVRAGQMQSDSLSKTVTGVNVIPASGEFVYATSLVSEYEYPGIERPINMNNSNGAADFSVSLDQLQSDLPLVTDAALTVAWFGDDLRAGSCRVRPGVEASERLTRPLTWSVDGVGRGGAYLISQTDGAPNYGGTPSDAAVLEGVAALKAAGIGVTLSPFLLMDVPPGNGLPDPYGGIEQAAFPWRGRITVSQDQTQTARDEIDAFVGEDGGFGFRHFILHHARLAVQAGGVEAFLIGSEMVALTRVRDAQGRFPFVEALIDIAAEVKALLGAGTAVSYAADWTEYGAYGPGDGSGDVLFPLDELWASPHVDFVGVDWYPPASDWRAGDDHLDYEIADGSIENPDYLRANLSGGEAYDWYYASQADRDAQIRTPIADTAHGEDWIFRQKDLSGWWSHTHFGRPGGVRASIPTAWTAGSKPIRLIEIGFPAIDKGPNAPNLFYDPKSSESAFPAYSTGARDDLLQRRALNVACAYWRAQPMVEQVLVWAWDGRPWPDFPSRTAIWSDGDNWQYGHWLNGRSGLIDVAEVIEDLSSAADVSLDAGQVSGVLDGYAIEGVTTLASALAPLFSVFDLNLIETGADLQAVQEGAVVAATLDIAHTVEDSITNMQAPLDKKPSTVRVNFISGDQDYQQGVIEVRDTSADTHFPLNLSLPMVLSESRARSLAQKHLDDTGSAETYSLSLPANVSPGLAVADRVSFDGTDWIIDRIEEFGLQRHLSLRAPRDGISRYQAVEPPAATAAVSLSATPFAVFIDGPDLRHLGLDAPFVVASADPWRGIYMAKFGPSADTLAERATLSAAAGIGRLEADLPTGPLGRWDEANTLQVYMPGETLSSVSEAGVFSGQNRLLVEQADGWELIAWRQAELIGDEIWQLTGLLRGLGGSQIREIEAGATVVLADSRLVSARLERDDIGVDQYWQLGTGDLQTLTYEDRAGLPWRVGHLQAQRQADQYRVSWTPRDPSLPDNWVLSDDPQNMTFQVQAYANNTLVLDVVQTDTQVTIDTGFADLIRVAALSDDGRVGEWGSIPLILD